MTKFIKWLITIYVFSILAWSSLLKAEEVMIERATFSEQTFELTLSGKITNSCGVSLKTKIIENQFTESGKLALIEIQNQQKDGSCSKGEQNEIFDLSVDVRSLGLTPGTNYQMTFAKPLSAGATPIFSVELPENAIYPDYQTSSASGILTLAGNGEWIIVQSPYEFKSIKTNLDLSRYVGQMVSVEGIEVLHRTGPVFDLEGHNPLRALPAVEAPVLCVLAISALAY